MSKTIQMHKIPAMPLLKDGLATPESSFVAEPLNRRKRKRTAAPNPYLLVLDPFSLGDLSGSSRVQVKKLARQGGPDLQDIRGYRPRMSEAAKESLTPSNPSTRRESGQPSTQKEKSSNTSAASGGKISPYERRFKAYVRKHGMHIAGTSRRPKNTTYILDRLETARAELSPEQVTEEKFRDFKKENEGVISEQHALATVFQSIIGKTSIRCGYSRPFNNLAHLAGGSLAQPRVDYCHGSEEYDIYNDVQEALNFTIMPNTDQEGPCLPNFFVEAKGTDGKWWVAANQLLYHGTLGARAMYQMRHYVDPSKALDDNAYTIGFTYQAAGFGPSLLSAYTVHPVSSKDPKLEIDYYLVHLSDWVPTKNVESYREAAQAIRNAADLAEEWRRALIEEANLKSTQTVSIAAASNAVAAAAAVAPPEGVSCTRKPSGASVASAKTQDAAVDVAQPAALPEIAESQTTESSFDSAEDYEGHEIPENSNIHSSFSGPNTPPETSGTRRYRDSPPGKPPSKKTQKRSR